MASIVRWNPFHDLVSLQRDVDRLFTDVGFIRSPLVAERLPMRSAPTMDVFTRGEDLVLKAELPGIRAEDVDISVTDDVLTLKADRHEEKEVKEDDYLFRETSWGTLERSMRLPSAAEVDKIHAVYEDGILEITVPKGAPEIGRTRKIAIEAHGAAREVPSEHH
ncbi:MAG: Hsp20/alpha crystallin family protein [Coriobacteriia bacterium]|nr:Hsp20/alpha crystallin family protein [Coriobacteriia bacterium]